MKGTEERPLQVVIGSGTAGIALTLRLLETCDVLLISEGDDTDLRLDPLIARADRWGAAALSDHPRRKELATLPDPYRDGRVQVYPRGVGAGGTSNINAMLCTAGSAKVFDDLWPDGWSAAALDPYLVEVENMGVKEVRCEGGLFKTIQRLCLSEARVSSSRSDLKSRLWDRGTNASYFGFFHGGHRSLLSDCLREARLGGRLRVMWNTSAVRLLFRPGTNDVSGIVVRNLSTGRTRFIRRPPGGEVILCAGVFESPRLLARSNLAISPPSQAASRTSSTYPVPPVQLPIGEALIDHTIVPLIGLGNWWSAEARSDSQNEPEFVFPGNSVHGWVNLGSDGRVLQPGDEQSAAW